MLEIPLRQAEEVDLNALIRAEYEKSPIEFTQDEKNSLETSCETIQQLRASICSAPPSLASLKLYYEYLNSLRKRVELKDSQFSWTNCLRSSSKMIGCGLAFETFNVLFNIGALYTKRGGSFEKKESDYLSASSVFLFMQNQPIPKEWPVELQPETLSTLSKLCFVQAKELAGIENKWLLAISYEQLMGELKNTPSSWSQHLNDRSKSLREEACIEASKKLHRSRKKSDQIALKALLLECLHHNPNNQDAMVMLEEPLGRRSDKKLKDVEGEMVPLNDYFRNNENKTSLMIPEFKPNEHETLFKLLLPLNTVGAPFVLQQKLRVFVQNMYVDPMSALNQTIRRCLTDKGIPAVVEAVRSPGIVPASLLKFHEASSHDFDTQFQQLFSRLKIAGLKLLGYDTAIVENLTEVVQHFHELWLSVKPQLEVLSYGEKTIAEFLEMKIDSSKERSKSLFMDKLEQISDRITNYTHTRDRKCREALNWALEYDFHTPALSADSLDFLNDVLEQAKLEFQARIDSLEHEEEIFTKQKQQIIALHDQFNRIPVVNTAKAKAAQGLYMAGMIAEVVLTKLNICEDVIRATDRVLPSQRPEKSQNVPLQFQWKPGMPIRFQ